MFVIDCRQLLLLCISCFVLPHSYGLVAAEDMELETLRELLVAREAQLSQAAWDVSRIYGPQPGLLDFNQADFEFRRIAHKAMGAPIPVKRRDPNSLLIKDSRDYWRVRLLGRRRLYYNSSTPFTGEHDAWTYRELFNGQHWERYEANSSLGRHVTLSTTSLAPALLAAVGIELPSAISNQLVRTSEFLDRIGRDWQLESIRCPDTLGDDKRVVLVASLQKHPVNGLPHLLMAEWDLAKGAAPLSLRVETAVLKDEKVKPLRGTQGLQVKWKSYQQHDSGVWFASVMTQSRFRDMQYVAENETVPLLHVNGQLFKGSDGYPLPDVERLPVKRYVVERDDWEISNFQINDPMDEADFDTSYPAGTIVQNELGPTIVAYQLTGDSNALTDTMRRIMEPVPLEPTMAIRDDGWKTLLLINVVMFTAIVVLVIVRYWRRRGPA